MVALFFAVMVIGVFVSLPAVGAPPIVTVPSSALIAVVMPFFVVPRGDTVTSNGFTSPLSEYVSLTVPPAFTNIVMSGEATASVWSSTIWIPLPLTFTLITFTIGFDTAPLLAVNVIGSPLKAVSSPVVYVSVPVDAVNENPPNDSDVRSTLSPSLLPPFA